MGITVCPKLYSYGYPLANIKSRPEGRLKCSKSHYNYYYRRERTWDIFTSEFNRDAEA